MDSISNNNRKDWDYYTAMNVNEFLTTLSFFKDKQDLHAAQIKKANASK